MSTECGFCKGTGIEPGFTECVWCDNTGRDGGIHPDAIKKAIARRFNKGDTYPSGDCDKFEAGIHVGDWFQRIAVYGDSPADAESMRDEILSALVSNRTLREELADRKAKHLRSCQIAIGKSQLAKQRHAEVNALQQRLTALDEQADGFEQRTARLRHVGMELTGVIDEYRAMPCESLKSRMFQTADRYRKRLTAKCGNCEDHGVIGYTTGQTPETFDQGEYPCPECHPTEYAAWSKP